MQIELYTRPNCSYCVNAKEFLRANDKPFVEYKLDEDFTREILLGKFPEASTYPVVVVDGFRIGGYAELREHINSQLSDTRRLLTE